MKKMLNLIKKNLKNNWLYLFLVITPFVLGIVGFALSTEITGSDVVFKTLSMYVLGYGDIPPNVIVNIARFMAAIVALGFAVTMLANISEKGNNWLQRKLLHRGKTICIYCDDEEWENFEEQLGENKSYYPLRGKNNSFVKADRYIFFMEESKNMEIYNLYKDRLDKKPVFIKGAALSVKTRNPQGFVLFSDEDVAGRAYWNTYKLYELSTIKKDIHITLVGHSELMEQLLVWGLLLNIFDKKQKITYHLFGDWSRFLRIYHEINQISFDKVVFEGLDWTLNQQLVSDSDRVLVYDYQNVSELLFSVPQIGSKLHYLSDDLSTLKGDDYDKFLSMLPEGNVTGNKVFEEPITFYWKEYAQNISRIIDGSYIAQGKRLNQYYSQFNPQYATEWDSLDAFTKYSNISSAAYYETWKDMLKDLGDSWQQVLTELEHERWCRFHYLYNWTVEPDSSALIENSVKLKAQRKHNCLVEFDRLGPHMVQNDTNNIIYLAKMAEDAKNGLQSSSRRGKK